MSEPISLTQSFYNLLESYPEFLTGKHLIELGMYPSKTTLIRATMRKTTPGFVRLSKRKILYPRNMVVDWLVDRAETRGIDTK